MELTLGPVLFDWKKTELLRFYEEVADMEVDTVYIGEVVCAKRNRLGPEEIEGIAAALQRAGKKVVASSLALVSNEAELTLVREVAAMGLPVEANDVSMLAIIDSDAKEVFAGPHLKTYNREAVRFLEARGVKRITFPVELPASSIAYNLEGTGVQGEVFAHGKLPLAMSWRCYSSKLHGLTKTNCQYHCSKDPDGLELRTMAKANEAEGEQCFAINGTSIMSAKAQSLIGFTDELSSMGVSALRISPHYRHTKETLRIFRERTTGTTDSASALSELKELYKSEFVNGWFLGQAGKANELAATAEAALL